MTAQYAFYWKKTTAPPGHWCCTACRMPSAHTKTAFDMAQFCNESKATSCQSNPCVTYVLNLRRLVRPRNLGSLECRRR
jgi:hypothetical protein